LKKRKIELKILNKFGAYPGHARNIAIKFSNFKILAFLDTTIITSDKWLQYGYYKITKDKYDLVFGKTFTFVSIFFIYTNTFFSFFKEIFKIRLSSLL
jgi:hypothetical protein